MEYVPTYIYVYTHVGSGGSNLVREREGFAHIEKGISLVVFFFLVTEARKVVVDKFFLYLFYTN